MLTYTYMNSRANSERTLQSVCNVVFEIIKYYINMHVMDVRVQLYMQQDAVSIGVDTIDSLFALKVLLNPSQPTVSSPRAAQTTHVLQLKFNFACGEICRR